MANDSDAEQKKWYVYFLCDPDTQMPFYVGKGTGDRAEQHSRFIESPHNANAAKKDVIRRILAEGKQVLVKRIAEFENEQDAYIYELAMINVYHEYLTNIRPYGGAQNKRLHRPRTSERVKKNPIVAVKVGQQAERRMYNRLTFLRAERGLSRADLAKAVGVNYQTIGYLERGEYNPSLDLAFRISEFFSLPIGVIFSTQPFKPLSEELYPHSLPENIVRNKHEEC